MCHSELTREFDTAVVRAAKGVLARPTEVGARTIVYGASFGPKSHGQYLPDCQIEAPAGIFKEKDIGEVQGRLWRELKGKLEAIQPGVTMLS